MTSKDRNRESDFSRKIKETVEKNRENQSTSPIILTSRKLTLDEIANHLDMDVETAILHLKSTNVHGYFSLSAKNLPTSGEFILYHVALDGKITPSKTFFVNGNGILVTQMDDVYVDLGNSFLFFSDYLAGEPADFVLASKDGKIFSAVHIIPNPIQVMDVKGRKLSVEVISPNKKEFLVNCTGCRPRQTYFINARFENERLGYEAVANQFGEILQKVGPTAPWMTGGDASIELHGDEIEHPLAVEFQWGGSEV